MRIVRTLVGRATVESSVTCLRSLARAFGDSYTLEIFDDGTLTPECAEALSAVSPRTKIVSRIERDVEIYEKLAYFPACRKQRDTHVLYHKLFDVTLTGHLDYLEYVDSDVYFLSRVAGGAQQRGSVPLFMHDVASSYAVRPGDLLGSSKLVLPAKLNTGIIGFPTAQFDLDLLEHTMRNEKFLSRLNHTACWGEQTCWALLASRSGASLIDPAQAQIVDSPKSVTRSPETVALHFISSYRSQLSRFAELNPFQGEREAKQWMTIEARPLRATELVTTGMRRRISSLQFSR